MLFVKTFVGNCKFFPFKIQLTSISKVAESRDLNNQSDDNNEDSDDEELDNATREVDKKTKCVVYIGLMAGI